MMGLKLNHVSKRRPWSVNAAFSIAITAKSFHYKHMKTLYAIFFFTSSSGMFGMADFVDYCLSYYQYGTQTDNILYIILAHWPQVDLNEFLYN